MADPTPIRILLVDDHTLFRKGIGGILAEEQGFQVVGEAGNGREAIEKAKELMPDVILMDISMPGMDGLEATRQIMTELPAVRIVILTVSDDDQNLFEAIKWGARGYLLKKVEPRALFNTLRAVAQGEAAFPREMAARILGEFARQARGPAETARPGANLSAREKEVLELLTQGKSNKEIAAAMAVAENTVKSYLKNILEKLHLQNRVQAATFALREGLVKKSPKKDE
jgi:DNA-binding NarL/FixJ family response regulator